MFVVECYIREGNRLTSRSDSEQWKQLRKNRREM